MKYILVILFTFLTVDSFAQGAMEHYDSLINGQLGKHKCEYNDEICYKNIQYAKNVLRKKKNPRLIIYSSSYGYPNYCYESELRSICKQKKIDIEDISVLCGSEITYRTCYYACLVKDIEERLFKGIEDSIHLWACKKFIKDKPNEPVFTIHSSYKNPISLSKKRTGSCDLDTLIIPLSKLNIKNLYDENFGLNRLIHLSVFIDTVGFPKIESVNFDLDELYPIPLDTKKSLRKLAVNHFKNNYRTWRPATFTGIKVPTRVHFKYSVLNKN